MNHKTAIIILGGDQDKNDPSRSNSDSFNRIKAGYYLHKSNPKQWVIASSGNGYSKIMKNELIALGVPSQLIIEERKSKNTYDQLLKLQKVIKKMSLKKLIFLSSTYHLPRIKTFIQYCPELKKFYRTNVFKLVSAEKVLKQFNPSSKKDIDVFYKSSVMKTIKAQEIKGITEIKAGTYRLKK